jgi:multiple sugar transport system permease protein
MAVLTERVEDRKTRVPVRRKRSARARMEARWGWILIAPSLAGLGVFSIWPIFRTLYYSFTLWGAFGGHTWTGLTNYRTLFSDSEVLQSLQNTLIFAALSLLSVPIGIVVAALLNRENLRGLTVYRTLYFIPVITLPAAIALMWKFVYNGDYGPINQILDAFGINGPHWTSDPSTALYAVAIVAIWSSVGYNMVLFLAGMQTIPRQFYEAAELDGAGRIRQFFRITLPLLSPTIFFVTVIGVINALQAFDLIYVMIGKNNPALDESETIVYLFYDKAFVQSNGGYAAAIAFLLLGIIIVFTAAQFWLQKKWVHYD